MHMQFTIWKCLRNILQNTSTDEALRFLGWADIMG